MCSTYYTMFYHLIKALNLYYKYVLQNATYTEGSRVCDQDNQVTIIGITIHLGTNEKILSKRIHFYSNYVVGNDEYIIIHFKTKLSIIGVDGVL